MNLSHKFNETTVLHMQKFHKLDILFQNWIETLQPSVGWEMHKNPEDLQQRWTEGMSIHLFYSIP